MRLFGLGGSGGGSLGLVRVLSKAGEVAALVVAGKAIGDVATEVLVAGSGDVPTETDDRNDSSGIGVRAGLNPPLFPVARPWQEDVIADAVEAAAEAAPEAEVTEVGRAGAHDEVDDEEARGKAGDEFVGGSAVSAAVSVRTGDGTEGSVAGTA